MVLSMQALADVRVLVRSVSFTRPAVLRRLHAIDARVVSGRTDGGWFLFPILGRLGHSLEVVGCVVFVVLGASGGVGRPLRPAKTSSTRKSYFVGFVASVFEAASCLFDNSGGLVCVGLLRAVGAAEELLWRLPEPRRRRAKLLL